MKRAVSISIVLLVAVLSGGTVASAAEGDPDTTFGSGGLVTTSFGAGNDQGMGMAIQSDGKLVVAGFTRAGTGDDFAVARYNTNGSLDTTFDADGRVTTSFGGGNDQAQGVAIQSDGKIVVAGTTVGATDDFAVARYNTNGSLDTTFDTDGRVTTAIGNSNDDAYSVVVQPDGKIVVAGETNAGNRIDFAFARYNANGSLDTTFSTDGLATAKFGGQDSGARAVALQSDDSIVAAGWMGTITVNDFAAVRLTTAGVLDTTFDVDGKVSTPIGAGDDVAESLAVQPDGNILLAGSSDNGTNYDFAAARYTTVGALDTTFDTDGKVTTPIGTGDDRGQSVALQGDGRILVAGSATSANADFGLVRYTTSGVLDTSFSGDGKLTTSFGSGNDHGQAVLVQPDTRVVVAGYATVGASTDFALARYFADSTPPDTAITGGPSGTVNTTSATFTFTSDDPSATFQCQLDGGAFAACTSPKTYTGLAQGSHTFSVKAVDPAGNQDATPAVRTWTVDTTPPDTTILTGPSGTVASSDASFTFSSSEPGSTFECRIDGGAFSACTSPSSYTGLTDGPHTFDVRAIDPAGNTDPTPAGRTWTIDTVAPDTAITGGPSGTVSTTSATFTFTSPDVAATFQCQIDGGAFSACTSPKTYTGLSQGSHTFSVKAVDPAGNEDPTPAVRTWSVDTVPPDTTITTGPSGTVGTPDATLTFSSSEGGSSFECRIDGAAFAGCTSPKAYSGLSDGSHTFDVRAIDPAGNTDPTPASRTWTVDTVPPDTTITGGPSGTVSTTSATFTFTSPDATASFQCELDSAGWVPCTSPANYSGLADGIHTFRVKAIDVVGNEDPTAASRTWTIDTTGPTTTILTGPSGLVASTDATFTFTASEVGSTFECALDGGAFSACNSPKSYSGLAQGPHTFQVRATDPANNVEDPPASRSWTVDTVAPDTSITSGPSGTVTSVDATLAFSSADPTATFRCKLDGGSYSPCVSPMTYNSLSEGAHTFSVKAVDPAGNEDPTPATRGWTIDNTAPTTTIDSGPAALVNTSGATMTFSASEPGSGFECRIDGAAFAACTSPKTYNGLSDGPHTFQVRATDSAGNTDQTPASLDWNVDTVPPDTVLDPSGPSGTTSATGGSFSFTSPDPGATFLCDLNGSGYTACTSPSTYSGLAPGDNTFSVKATDPAGNEDPTPATRTWTIIAPSHQPDAMVKAITSGAYVGFGKYSTDGTGETLTRKLKQGGSVTFDIAVGNDGNVVDGATIQGCSSTGPFIVNYAAGIDVTTGVKAGTHVVGPMAPGVQDGLNMGVKVKSKAKHGSVLNCLVTATSTAEPTAADTIKVTIKVK